MRAADASIRCSGGSHASDDRCRRAWPADPAQHAPGRGEPWVRPRAWARIAVAAGSATVGALVRDQCASCHNAVATRSEDDHAVLGCRPQPVTTSSRDQAAATRAPAAFHLLAKPTGAVCNLDCAYCFFLSKEMLYPGSRFRMADELLETYLRQLIDAHGGVPEVQVAWQGGEPTLMGLEFFRRSVEIANRYLRLGQRAVYSIQTNGTLIDDEWAAFFMEHDFLVGISIDGPRELHDTYRVNKGGRGSFDQVMRRTRAADRRRGRVERADDRTCGQRRPRPRGLLLPARCVRCAVYPVHPDRRARHGGERRRRRPVDLVAGPTAVCPRRRAHDLALGGR